MRLSICFQRSGKFTASQRSTTLLMSVSCLLSIIHFQLDLLIFLQISRVITVKWEKTVISWKHSITRKDSSNIFSETRKSVFYLSLCHFYIGTLTFKSDSSIPFFLSILKFFHSCHSKMGWLDSTRIKDLLLHKIYTLSSQYLNLHCFTLRFPLAHVPLTNF